MPIDVTSAGSLESTAEDESRDDGQSDADAAAFAQITEIVDRAGELLPAQGPITAFVFLNTLQALEDLPFAEGLKKGAPLFGCRPYLAEEQYRERMQHGRIRRSDLAAALREDLGAAGDERICHATTRFDLRLGMLEHPLRTMDFAEILRRPEKRNATFFQKHHIDASHDVFGNDNPTVRALLRAR